MSKMFDSLLLDVINHLKTPEVQAALELHVVRPVIASVMHILYPYLLGVMLLWILMFVLVVFISFTLVRGSLVGLSIGILK